MFHGLSIVIITCNREKELRNAILSCECHVSIEHNYIVWDNGSTDGTEEMIAKLKIDGLKINYYKSNNNLGVAGGRNMAWSKANGDVCYFIDDDATIISNGLVLDKAYTYIKQHGEIYAMGTDCYDTERKMNLRGPHERYKKNNEKGMIANFIGCSHFICKERVRMKELYPGNLLYGSEEKYLGCSIYRENGIIYYYPELKVLHCPSKNTREKMENRRRDGHINTYVIKKYFLPRVLIPICSFLFVLRICRFEKMNLKRIYNDIKIAKARYDGHFRIPFSFKKLLDLCGLFGVKLFI